MQEGKVLKNRWALEVLKYRNFYTGREVKGLNKDCYVCWQCIRPSNPEQAATEHVFKYYSDGMSYVCDGCFQWIASFPEDDDVLQNPYQLLM